LIKVSFKKRFFMKSPCEYITFCSTEQGHNFFKV
jgi:hypothetical protein